MLELKGINRIYKSKKSSNTQALKDINLKFESSGLVFIVGSSGSGKSTLLNVIGSLDKYDSGDLIIDGKSTKKFKNKDFDYYRNNYIGFIFQDFNIIDDYNIIDNINLPLKLQNKKRDSTDLLKKLGIEDLCKRKPNELSGGEKQRVAIARALIKDPKIILADEPTGNLDSKNSKSIMDLLKEISKDRLVIVVSHNLELAESYSDRIIEIKDGSVINDNNNTEVSSSKKYDVKKSKLPFKDIMKLGLNSLKDKKLRMIFSIILISFSVIFLGVIFSIKSYNSFDIQTKIISKNNDNVFKLKNTVYQKYYKIGMVEQFKDNDLAVVLPKIKSDYAISYYLNDEKYFWQIFNLNVYIQYDIFNDPPEEETDMYTNYDFNPEIIASNDSHIEEEIIGKYPQKNDEILITNYMADIIIKYGVYEYESEKIFKPNSYKELINSNKTLYFGSYNPCKIVGIIKHDLSEYHKLIGLYHTSKNNFQLPDGMFEIGVKLREDINKKFNKIYVKQGFIDNLKEPFETTLDNSRNDFYYKLNGEENNNVNYINKEIEYYNGSIWTKTSKLEDNEVILSPSSLIYNYNIGVENYILSNTNKNAIQAKKEFILKNIDVNKYIGKFINLKFYSKEGFFSEDRHLKYEIENIKIIGITGYTSYEDNFSYFSKNLLQEYKKEYAIKDHIIIYENDINTIKYYLKTFSRTDKYKFFTQYSEDIERNFTMFKQNKQIINVLFMLFLMFSILLICNLMFSSISSKKKMIGTLKSLGTKNSDIIKIFIFKGIFIAIISSVLGLVLLNELFKFELSLEPDTLEPLIFPYYINNKLIMIVFGYNILITIIASLIPLIKITKMKPIDAIKRGR